MSHLLTDHARVQARRETLWDMVDDPVTLARVLPGAETVVMLGPGRFQLVMSTRLQFLTIRADVAATVRDTEPTRRRHLELDGRPRGLAGSFRVSIDMDMDPADGPDGPGSMTEISFVVDLDVTGRLATFGAPILRETVRRQVAQLVANVEREAVNRGAAEGPAA